MMEWYRSIDCILESYRRFVVVPSEVQNTALCYGVNDVQVLKTHERTNR